MTKFLRFLPLFLVAVFAVPASAGQGWVEVRSPHFRVLTDVSPQRGREIALHFEQMRLVFGDLFRNPHVNLPVPLEVVALRNDGELRPLAPLYKGKPVQVPGFFQPGDDRSFIVVDDSSPAGWEIGYHEYARQLLAANLPAAAPWFDDGFAELLQSMRIKNGAYEIGAPPRDIESILLHGKFTPVAELFPLPRPSETYGQPGEQRAVFYAQSWLTVHYLHDKKKLPETMEYFRLVRQHTAVADAIQQAYGMDAAHLDQEIAAYRARDQVAAITGPIAQSPDPASFAVTPLTALQVTARLADVKLHSSDHQAEAVADFKDILRTQPDDPSAHVGLGYADLRNDQFDEALQHFRQAVKHAGADPRAYYFVGLAIARRSMTVGKPPADLAEMTADVQKAIALDPSFADAYSTLAFADLLEGDRDAAVSNCKKAAELDVRNERYALNLARAYMAAGQPLQAQDILQRLKDSPNRDIAFPAQQDLARVEPEVQNYTFTQRHKMPSTYDAPQWHRSEAQIEKGSEKETPAAAPDTRPTKYLSGELVSVDCSRPPTAELTIRSGRKTLHMLTPDRSKLLLVGADQFSCSWKDRKVLVNYKAGGKADGDLVSIELQ